MNKNNKNDSVQFLKAELEIKEETIEKLSQINNDASQIICEYITENESLKQEIKDLKQTITKLENELADDYELQLERQEQFYYTCQTAEMEDF